MPDTKGKQQKSSFYQAQSDTKRKTFVNASAEIRDATRTKHKAKLFTVIYHDTSAITGKLPVMQTHRSSPLLNNSREEPEEVKSEEDERTVKHMTQQEYMRYKEAFIKVDKNGSGELSWAEVTDLSSMLGCEVDLKVFKRLDKDRSGQVDFTELLRVLFPHVPKWETTLAVKKWGLPLRADEQAANRWWERFDQNSINELKDIFKLFQRSQEETISAEDVKAKLPKISALTASLIDDVWARCDRHGKGSLNLEEFATVMEDTYLTGKSLRPHVKLYFQENE